MKIMAKEKTNTPVTMSMSTELVDVSVVSWQGKLSLEMLNSLSNRIIVPLVTPF